jgi:hypothetical protein
MSCRAIQIHFLIFGSLLCHKMSSALLESAAGFSDNMSEKINALIYEAKAKVKETFGKDGTEDRMKAEEHRQAGEAKLFQHAMRRRDYEVDKQEKKKEKIRPAKDVKMQFVRVIQDIKTNSKDRLRPLSKPEIHTWDLETTEETCSPAQKPKTPKNRVK